MAEGKQGFLERYPLPSALMVVLIFVVVCLLGAYFSLENCKSFFEIFPNKVNEWGDFLAGIFAPAALFFLALSVRIQSRELRAAVAAQKAMKDEMESQVSQMRFSGMAPFFYAQAEHFYKKLSEAGIDEYFLSNFGIFNVDASISDFIDSKKGVIEHQLSNDLDILKTIVSPQCKSVIKSIWGRDVLYLYKTFYSHQEYINQFLNNYKSFEILFNASNPEKELQVNFLGTRYSDFASKIIYLQLNHKNKIDEINEMINNIFEKTTGSRPRKVF
ncbi:hypothetical protein [Elstera sp.]|uniref:hypothetical protein n=1 Tax=Elstera sp. TaxID=1916664 RepID=UPI0037C0A7F7